MSVFFVLAGGADQCLVLQDLKQQKFVIDAEPSETVCQAFFASPSFCCLGFVVVDLWSTLGHPADVGCHQVGQVKGKISQEKEWDAAQLKLIYSGQ